MPFDGFLKIDGIKGECKDDKHKDEIDVSSFSYGVTQSTSVATGGGLTAGKSTLNAFAFNQTYHKGSVPLFVYCATGKHLKEATLTVRKAGESPQDFLIIKMNDVLISAVQDSGSSEVPTESVSLQFAGPGVVAFDREGRRVNVVSAN